MTEPRKPRPKPKAVIHLEGTLGCQRCPTNWLVSDLNPERKAVPCPVCGTLNDIKEALKRAE